MKKNLHQHRIVSKLQMYCRERKVTMLFLGVELSCHNIKTITNIMLSPHHSRTFSRNAVGFYRCTVLWPQQHRMAATCYQIYPEPSSVVLVMNRGTSINAVSWHCKSTLHNYTSITITRSHNEMLQQDLTVGNFFFRIIL